MPRVRGALAETDLFNHLQKVGPVVVSVGAICQAVLVEDKATEGEGAQDLCSPASELDSLGGVLLEEAADEVFKFRHG